ncbi:hypothetical protein ColTof4_08626 [Colletotrichum tofieldiae]|nr:hypothetical protein ColTof3_04173 [Colletotrichum tofieldiae]GKT76203.1 hypothetical protein ColTof4_08626 [Colletotrichum tofieldiae]
MLASLILQTYPLGSSNNFFGLSDKKRRPAKSPQRVCGTEDANGAEERPIKVGPDSPSEAATWRHGRSKQHPGFIVLRLYFINFITLDHNTTVSAYCRCDCNPSHEVDERGCTLHPGAEQARYAHGAQLSGMTRCDHENSFSRKVNVLFVTTDAN